MFFFAIVLNFSCLFLVVILYVHVGLNMNFFWTWSAELL
jgi:hypothetical protein